MLTDSFQFRKSDQFRFGMISLWRKVRLFNMNNSHMLSKWKKKLNDIENLREKMNDYKISGMKDPFKELSFFISPGLKYLGIHLWKCKSKMKALFSIP